MTMRRRSSKEIGILFQNSAVFFPLGDCSLVTVWEEEGGVTMGRFIRLNQSSFVCKTAVFSPGSFRL